MRMGIGGADGGFVIADGMAQGVALALDLVGGEAQGIAAGPVAQRPAKLAEGIGGILLLNLSYIAVLYASVAAFGGSMSIALVAVVYLAGATIGQAAPTPGGLGAVEAALVAGLTAAGLDAGTAVSAVLLYRLITFWLPTVPGYWAFTKLTREGLL